MNKEKTLATILIGGSITLIGIVLYKYNKEVNRLAKYSEEIKYYKPPKNIREHGWHLYKED